MAWKVSLFSVLNIFCLFSLLGLSAQKQIPINDTTNLYNKLQLHRGKQALFRPKWSLDFVTNKTLVQYIYTIFQHIPVYLKNLEAEFKNGPF